MRGDGPPDATSLCCLVSALIRAAVWKERGTPEDEIRPIVESTGPAFAFVVICLDVPYLGPIRCAGIDAVEEVGPPSSIERIAGDVSAGNTLADVVPYPTCSMLARLEVLEVFCSERYLAVPSHEGVHAIVDRIHENGLQRLCGQMPLWQPRCEGRL